MSRGTHFLTALRVLALLCALAVVALGALSKFLVDDVESRGENVVGMLPLEENQAQQWRDYFTTIENGVMRVWATIGAASIGSIATFVVVLASMLERMRMSTKVLIPLEYLAMCTMAGAFGAALSFAMALHPYSSVLDTVQSPALVDFEKMGLISKIMVIAAGTAGFLLLVLCISVTVAAINRARAKETCSFEPTASGLGMGHGYQAAVPTTSHSRVPTMYDPKRPLNGKKDMKMIDEEETIGFASQGSQMSFSDSGLSEMRRVQGVLEKDIRGQLNAISGEKAPQVLAIRPSRPWSEAPKARDNTVHAL